MNEPDVSKRRAAEEAAREVVSDSVVGLGSGSTARLAVEAVSRRLAEGEIAGIVGIPTSASTRALAIRLHIPLTSFEEHPQIDLTIDGADQVDPNRDLIKGGGGALLWEKIVAAQSRRYLIVVDESKLVRRLGEGFPVPVEVMPFGWSTHLPLIAELGATGELRRKHDGEPFVTDGGHYIIDCRFPSGMSDPAAIERRLIARPGVVETGLFLGMSPEVIVGRSE